MAARRKIRRTAIKASDSIAAPVGPYSSFTGASRDQLATVLDKLRDPMTIGHFGAARAALHAFGEDRLHSAVEQLRSEDDLRRSIAGTLAEVYSHYGENAKARQLLRDYLDQGDAQVRFLNSDIPVRIKLQLAEAYYAQRQFDRAIDLALQIRSQVNSKTDLWSIGESSYYLTRYFVRRNRLAEAALHAASALESFSLASPRQRINPLSLQWRTGLLFLAEGNANWRSGNLTAARARLSVARWLLTQTADTIGIGNVEQSLGCILRSQGHFRESLKAFVRARRVYQRAGHQLNLSRVLTNLGRTCVLYGLHGGGVRSATTLRRLDRALSICDQGEADDPMWKRQTLEALIWKSWFYVQPKEHRDLTKAQLCAEKALRLASDVESHANVIEANLALGYCGLYGDDLGNSAKNFTSALKLALDFRLTKCVVNAHLSLAELYCMTVPRDLYAAERHYSAATRLMDEAAGLGSTANRLGTELIASVSDNAERSREPRFSVFLTAKARRICELIGSVGDALLITSDEIGLDKEQLGMARVVDRARKWAIEVALRKAGGNRQVAAKVLKMSRQALHQQMSRALHKNAG